MTTRRFLESLLIPRWSDRRFERSLGVNYLAILAGFCLLAPQAMLSQEKATAGVTNAPLETNIPAAPDVVMTKPLPTKQQVESELAVMTMIPDGDYRLFSATVRCKAWTVGVEYDRHSWGHLLKSQVDYVVEVIPIVILSGGMQPIIRALLDALLGPGWDIQIVSNEVGPRDGKTINEKGGWRIEFHDDR